MDNGTNAKEKRTLVEEGTNFKGTLSSSCPVDVRGRVEGEIETPSLTVSASGAVHGRAKVGSVRSEGELSGEFEADRVELAGRVRDNTIIRARSLEVKLAANRGKMQVTFGECELSVGDEPSEHDVVPEPVAIAAPEPPPAAIFAVLPEPAPPAIVPESPAPAADMLAPEELSESAIEEGMVKAAEPAAVPVGGPAATADASLDELLAAFRTQPPPAGAKTETNDDGNVEAGSAEALGSDEDGNGKSVRKRRKAKGDNDSEHSGWSEAPSQPPPATSS
ncbi:MAG TPA: polymer-forming cytoskeletal protein [Polyangiaceae bacterium]|jgi:cytoskeletal protein CcmA (bactofilin family)|nr:polymer-forming cytoskeletal protein [Polyangiaceae bacterium]